MSLGVFLLKTFGEFLFVAASTKSNAVGGGGRFLLLAGAGLLVLARYFPELRDFYYISVI